METLREGRSGRSTNLVLFSLANLIQNCVMMNGEGKVLVVEGEETMRKVLKGKMKA